MSDRELDNLFKNKLEDFETKPSAKAWDKIQGSIQTKEATNVWHYSRIAAAILILITCGSLFLLNQTDEQPLEQLAENTKPNPKTEVKSLGDRSWKTEDGSWKIEVGSKSSDNKSQLSSTDNRENHLSVKAKSTTESSNSNTAPQPETKHQKLITENNKHQTSNSKHQTVNSELKTENSELKTENSKQKTVNSELKTTVDATFEATTASTEQQTESKGQTLIFNIEDFKTETTVASAEETEEEKDKKTVFKKVLDFAKNVKEGDGGLGELREAKNDLFAFNFKKDDNSK